MFWGLEFETPDYVLSPYRESEQAKAIMTKSGFINVKSLADTSGDLRFTMGQRA